MKIGICYRPYLHKKFLKEIIDKISFIELMPDIMTVSETNFIKDICYSKKIDMGLHCLRSSLFSPEGPQMDKVENYYYFSEYIHSKYFSDHIAYSSYRERYLTSVQPIRYNDKNLFVFQNNMTELRKYFPKNFSIENITQNTLFSESIYSESTFIRKLTEQQEDITLLFDLTNMYITAKRNNIPFEKYILNYPFDKVKIVHVSGLYKDKHGIYQDTHSTNFDEEILIPLRMLKSKMSNLEYLLVERDFNVNSPDDILGDLEKLKEIFE
jgi:uncharacterized protein (UPF0276 family)